MTGREHATVLGFIAFVLGSIFGSGFTIYTHPWSVSPPDSATVVRQAKVHRRDLDREMIRMDISAFGDGIGLSGRQRDEYVAYLDSAATRYSVPPLLLHALCSIESSYNPLAEHPQITVRGKRTRAVGLTGVVWEYHADKLKSEGIASARLELTEPAVNLMASACIVRDMMRSIVHDYAVKGKVLADTVVFKEFVRRYYGAYNDVYQQKVLVRIKETAGRQWMRRVAQDVLSSFQVSDVVIGSPSNITREVSHAPVSSKSAQRPTVLAGYSSVGSRRCSLSVVAGQPAAQN
jgi:hypothetical protein